MIAVCVSTDGGTDFTVANSSIANPTDSYPGGGNDYDVAYDIWLNQTPATSTAAPPPAVSALPQYR